MKTALAAMFLVLTPLGLAGCQSSGAQGVQAAKSADEASEAEQLLARLKELEKKSSTDQFDKTSFEKRKETALNQVVVLTIAGCLEAGESLSNLTGTNSPPCFKQSIANLFDPSGAVAENCGDKSSQDAFIECAGNGLFIGFMKDFLGQKMQPSDWRSGDGVTSATASEMADRIIGLCVAERSSNIDDCTVKKAGQAFAVPAADISFCQNQGSFRAKLDCLADAAALALFESAAKRRVSL